MYATYFQVVQEKIKPTVNVCVCICVCVCMCLCVCVRVERQRAKECKYEQYQHFENLAEGYTELYRSLYYFCNFSVNLKLFQGKKG